MNVVVIVESCFGNTHHVAEAIADGLRQAGGEVSLQLASEASAEVRADLVVVAAPTHNLGLPSPSSRAQAAQRGGEVPASGVREWLDASAGSGARLVAVDTVVAGAFSGSAAKAAQKLARRRGWRAERGPSFVVTSTQGPLRDGELDRARTVGRSLLG